MRFPGRALDSDELAPEAGEGAEAQPVEHARPPRSRDNESDSLWRYVLTALGLFVAVGLVSLALIQATQAGRSGRADPAPSSQAGSAPVAQPPPAAAPPQAAAPAPAGSGAIRVTSRVVEPRYVVAPGDTLGSIAAKTGTSVEALQSINNLADRNLLSVGQRLVIPNQD